MSSDLSNLRTIIDNFESGTTQMTVSSLTEFLMVSIKTLCKGQLELKNIDEKDIGEKGKAFQNSILIAFFINGVLDKCNINQNMGNQQLAKLKTSLNEKNDELKPIINELSSLDAKITETKQDIEAKKADIADKMEILDKEQERLNKSKKDFDDIESLIKDVENQIDNYCNQNSVYRCLYTSINSLINESSIVFNNENLIHLIKSNEFLNSTNLKNVDSVEILINDIRELEESINVLLDVYNQELNILTPFSETYNSIKQKEDASNDM